MPNTVILLVKVTLLSTLMASFCVSAANPENNSNRWLCRATDDSSWQCANINPADGTGTYFVAPEKAPAATHIANQEAKTSFLIDGEKLDWLPLSALSEEQKLNAKHCSGSYIEPAYIDPQQRDLDPSTQSIQASAKTSQTGENGITTLTGNVVLSQGYRQIKSAQAKLDRDAGTVHFTGRTQIREPGVLLVGENAKINLDSDEANLNNVQFVDHKSHLRGSAKNLQHKADGIMRATQASITTCPPGVNAWALVGDEVALDAEAGTGVIKNARLHIKEVPVMYLPYLSFPLDEKRKSGFLTPTFGSSDGFDIAAPFYWNIAPNYDATLTPRIIGDRGAMAEAEVRYLHNNNSGILGGAYLPSDDLFNNKNRWLGILDHQGTLFGNIKTRAKYLSVSDNNYFSDLGTDLNASSQTHLRRFAELSYNNHHWDITTRVQNFQTIDPDITAQNKPYELLPQIKAEGFYPYLNSGLVFGLLAEYSNFNRDNAELTGLDRAVGHRTRIEPSVSWLFETPFAYIKPKATYRYAHYTLDDLDNPGFNDTPKLSVPVYSIDSGLFFERDISWAGNSGTQTFEPRLFYLRVPEEKNQQQIPLFDTSQLDFSYSQLFRENRFVGGDRIGDANQLSLGLTSRFIENDGFERARASIGQIFYNDDRGVSLSGTPADTDSSSDSPLAGELMYAFTSNWRLQGDIEWDPSSKHTNQSSLNLRYHSDNDHIVNIGYRARNPDNGLQRLEQADISTIWPLDNHWRVISRWNHDLNLNRVVEAFAGFEYKSCCWAVRILGHRLLKKEDITINNPNGDGVEKKNTLFIEFELNGLGRSNKRTDSLFKDIPGYH